MASCSGASPEDGEEGGATETVTLRAMRGSSLNSGVLGHALALLLTVLLSVTSPYPSSPGLVSRML